MSGSDILIGLAVAAVAVIIAYMMGYLHVGELPPAANCPPPECPKAKCPASCQVFDAKHYLNKYEDLKNAFGDDGAKAAWHFFNWGVKEGRSPIDGYDPEQYRSEHPDLKDASVDNVFYHYAANKC